MQGKRGKKEDWKNAIWDGKSKGTKHTIDFAKKHDKPIEIHIIPNEEL